MKYETKAGFEKILRNIQAEGAKFVSYLQKLVGSSGTLLP